MRPIHLFEATEVHLYGSKAVNLGKALQQHLQVPDGYVLSASDVQQFVAGELNLETDIRNMLNSIGSVSVRSSAIQEDGEQFSYAGLFQSCLNITTHDGIERAMRYIWESAQSSRLLSYRRRVEPAIFEDEVQIRAAIQVALIMQRTIASDVSGIMFTRNPVTNEDERVIEATWGLGETIASGHVTPDYFRMNREGKITEATVSFKEVAVHVGQGEGTIQNKLANHIAQSLCLTTEQCRELNCLAEKCEHAFGRDLDIEWAFADGKLWLIQCRRITGLKFH